jgi:hypothetical protein
MGAWLALTAALYSFTEEAIIADISSGQLPRSSMRLLRRKEEQA